MDISHLKTFVRSGTDLLLSHSTIEEYLCQEKLIYFAKKGGSKHSVALVGELNARIIQTILPLVVLGLLDSQKPDLLEAMSISLEAQIAAMVEKNQILDWLREDNTMKKITDRVISMGIAATQKDVSSQVITK